MKRNLIEWAVLLTSVVAIALLVAVLVLEGLTEARPADPRVELRPAEARQGTIGWIVPASVSNGGDAAVQALVLEASATVGGTVETSELEVDYLPAGTSVEVAFAFSGPPSGQVAVRLVGYRQP
ncbi:MAG: hypothetical protein M3N29_08775 [Chloroflexota bacterium]|nr:hypothetical protein [Chloroflexota bacterium]